MTTLPLRLAAGLAAGAIALTACGGDSPDDAVTSNDQGIAVGEPNGEDPNGASGTMLAGTEFTPQERADMVLGQTEEQAMNLALEFGWTIRTGRVDDDQRMLTEDYNFDRMTIELDTPDGGGEPLVTSVTIELEGGPQTFAAA